MVDARRRMLLPPLLAAIAGLNHRVKADLRQLREVV
jgi:hypothetical protein